MKNQKGITLIALIITIIVLLILAGVSITMLNGDNGVINKASESKEKNRATSVKETVELALMEKTLGDSSITKEGIITELLSEGVLTEEEAQKLANQEEITIGGITINFEQLSNKLVGKFVYYKGMKFMVVSETEEKVELHPLTFPKEHYYTLSPYYKVENGRKVSVEPGTAGAILDTDFEVFKARILEELNYACQETFGTSDGKIIANMAQTRNDLAIKPLNALERLFNGGSLESLTHEQYVDILDRTIKENKKIYDVTEAKMAQVKRDNRTTFLAACWFAGGPGIEEGYICDLEKIRPDLEKYSKGEITKEYVNSIEDPNYKIMLATAMRLTDLFVFDAVQCYWLPQVTYKEIEGNNYYLWQVRSINGNDVFHDVAEERQLVYYRDGEFRYSAESFCLTPILTVDTSLLEQRLGTTDVYDIK